VIVIPAGELASRFFTAVIFSLQVKSKRCQAADCTPNSSRNQSKWKKTTNARFLQTPIAFQTIILKVLLKGNL
jgi:hypothetical protein